MQVLKHAGDAGNHRAAPTRKKRFGAAKALLNVFSGGVAAMFVAIIEYGPCTTVALQIE